MLKQKKVHRWNGKVRGIVLDWVRSYSIILLLPLCIAVFNQVYADRLLQSEVQRVNQMTAENLCAGFDNAMELLAYANEVVYSSTEYFTLRASDSHASLSFASMDLIKLLSLHCRTNEGLSMVVYIPFYDHIITETSAYTLNGTWRVLCEENDLSVSYEDYLAELNGAVSQGGYFFSDWMGNGTFGKTALCYAVSQKMDVPGAGYCHLIACLSADLLLPSSANLPDGCLLAVVASDGTVLRAWDNAGNAQNLPSIDLSASGQTVSLGGENYVALSAQARANDWSVVVFTPRAIFAQALLPMRMVAIATLTGALLVGVVLVALFLKRHYSPVSNILSVVGQDDATAGNEYDRILSACQSLRQENTSIKGNLRMQEAYIREKFLLSQLLGRGSRLSDQPVARQAAALFEGKILRMIVFCLPGAEDAYLSDRFDEMQYHVHQLLLGKLGEANMPQRVTDNNWLVYLFALTSEQNEVWLDEASALAGAVCDAFESEMHLPLLAVLSNPCERLDLANEIYAELTGVVECLCAAGESGAIPAREVLKHNDRINTSRHIAQRKLREAIAQGNEKAADASLTELFGYIAEKSALSFQVTRFLYFDILRIVGKGYDDALPDGQEGRERLQICLGELMQSADQAKMEEEIRTLVRIVCSEILRHKVAASAGVGKCVCDYIHANYSDMNLNISHIAAALNLSPQTVTKYCRQETNMSVLDYINRIRIDHAKRLAQETSMSLEDLAEAVGYASLRTFYRAFTKMEGTTPAKGLRRA